MSRRMERKALVAAALLVLVAVSPTAGQSLWWAAYRGLLPKVNSLIAEGADPNIYWTDTDDNECIINGILENYEDDVCGMPLLASAAFEKVSVIEGLLTGGATIDENSGSFVRSLIPSRGLTPLHVYVLKNNSFGVEVLLLNGADPNVPTGIGSLALGHAVQLGNSEIVDFLVAALVDVDGIGDDGNTALHLAINRKTRSVEFVEQLLAAGACPNVPDADGNTALHIAADIGRIDIVEKLLESGADTNKRNNQGLFPIDLACKKNTGSSGSGCKTGELGTLLKALPSLPAVERIQMAFKPQKKQEKKPSCL